MAAVAKAREPDDPESALPAKSDRLSSYTVSESQTGEQVPRVSSDSPCSDFSSSPFASPASPNPRLSLENAWEGPAGAASAATAVSDSTAATDDDGNAVAVASSLAVKGGTATNGRLSRMASAVDEIAPSRTVVKRAFEVSDSGWR